MGKSKHKCVQQCWNFFGFQFSKLYMLFTKGKEIIDFF